MGSAVPSCQQARGRWCGRLTSDVILLKRRSVQSYIKINLFPLEESRSYDPVNSTFLGGSVRVK